MDEHTRQRAAARIRGAWRLAVYISLGVLVTSAIAAVVAIIIERHVVKLPTMALVAILLLVALGLLLFLHRQIEYLGRQTTARARWMDAADIPDRRFLICGYSPIYRLPDKPCVLDIVPSEITMTIEDACGWSGINFGSWQQSLRVLRVLKGISHVYVINPNLDQFAKFHALMKHFFPTITVTRVGNKGMSWQPGDAPLADPLLLEVSKGKFCPADYENFDYVTAAIDRAFAMIRADSGLPLLEAEGQALIDITGGLKTFSIAGAIASLNREINFVYAGTGEKSGQVHAYDAWIDVFQGQVTGI